MKKIIFFMIAILFFANTHGMEKGNVAEKKAFFESFSTEKPSTPKGEAKKAAEQPMSEQEHLAKTFPQGHPAEELSDDNIRKLMSVLYPNFFKSK